MPLLTLARQHLRHVRRLVLVRRERGGLLPHKVEPRSLTLGPQQRSVDVIHRRHQVHPGHSREFPQQRLCLGGPKLLPVDVVEDDVQPPRRVVTLRRPGRAQRAVSRKVLGVGEREGIFIPTALVVFSTSSSLGRAFPAFLRRDRRLVPVRKQVRRAGGLRDHRQ